MYISTYAFLVYTFSVWHMAHVEPHNIYAYYFEVFKSNMHKCYVVLCVPHAQPIEKICVCGALHC